MKPALGLIFAAAAAAGLSSPELDDDSDGWVGYESALPGWRDTGVSDQRATVHPRRDAPARGERATDADR